MKPWASAPRSALRRVRALFTDLDDTLTSDGRVTLDAFRALWTAWESRILPVTVVTGRPAGWCDHLVRMWPIRGVVGENGAFYFWRDDRRRRIGRMWRDPPNVRARNRARLRSVERTILKRVPGAAVSADQEWRAADLAIDFCEDAGPLGNEEVQEIVRAFREAGATCKVSSIHVNGWFGRYDKLGMMRRFARQRLGLDIEAEPGRAVFVGDSPNDAPLFGAFPLSVGVANVRRFLDQMDPPPQFVTRARAGAGFAEVVNALLRART